MLSLPGHVALGGDARPDGWRVSNTLKSHFSRSSGRIPEDLKGDYLMAGNRIAAGCLMLIFTLSIGNSLLLRHWVMPILAWLTCGLTLLAHLRFAPRHSVLRRCLAIVLDVAGATIMLAAGGEATAFLYVVYLWIIIGNGFRFGGGYIFAASLASTLGFGGLIVRNTFWHSHLTMSLGLMSGLVILPAYAFTLIRQLAKARRRAEQGDRAKSLFLACVSHELRTPLNAIIGTAELLQRTELDADQLEMVSTINSAADGQLSLIKDVMEFSRIEVGGVRIEAKGFDLAVLLGVVRDIAAVEARGKGLLINTYITARTPLRLMGDERRLRETLLNLCSNAVKFTSAGSVTLSADATDAGKGVVRLRLEVMDTGIGITPEAQQHIFDLFTQADPTILDRFGGTGLGLALCKRQIQLMGGSIGVESAPNAGSTFWLDVELPIEVADEPAPPAVSAIAVSENADWMHFMQQRLDGLEVSEPPEACIAFVQEGGKAPPLPNAGALIEVMHGMAAGLPPRLVRERFATTVSLNGSIAELQQALQIAAAQAMKSRPNIAPSRAGDRLPPLSRLAGFRVLIADDNVLNRSIVSKMLDSAGLHTICASDGEQALEILTGGKVDVALLDVNMPVMTGIETAEFYNISVLGGRRVPLIALTADATPETRIRCLKAGMDAYLVKPLRRAELVGALEDVVAGPLARNVITFEPRSQPVRVLDLSVLVELKSLGGVAFLDQVLEGFRLDGSAVLAGLEAACQQGDVHRFRSESHSLCSIGANVGAKALRDLCTPWKDIAEDALLRDGPVLLAEVKGEWRRTCLEFEHYAADQQEQPLGVLHAP